MSTGASKILYPKECQLCNKFRVQYQKKRYEPYKILTFDAEKALKAAAKVKKNELFNEIKDIDLISKEFKVHKHCYRQFTHGFTSGITKDDDFNVTVDEVGMNAADELKTSCYEKGNFDGVVKIIEEEVIDGGRTVSLKCLHKTYALSVNDRRYKYYLKERLIAKFGDRIMFLSPLDDKATDIYVCYSSIDDIVKGNNEVILKRAAKILVNDTVEKFKNIPQPPWPPTSDELSKDCWKPPPSAITFATALFGDKKELSQKQKRLAESLAADLIHLITSGKVIQQKHFLLALGLHNITGSRKIIDIVHNLGHCMSYNTTCEIKTAAAEVAMLQMTKKDLLPIKPITNDKVAPTFFWVDNFDVTIDRLAGGGSVNTTHLMAFQEKTNDTFTQQQDLIVPKRRSRRLFYEDVTIPCKPVDAKKNPPALSHDRKFEYDSQDFNKMFYLWVFLRSKNSFDQIIPNFKGWMTQIRDFNYDSPEKTVETFLPPITSKVTEFQTIHKYLSYLQSLAKSVNMPYVNVTLDVGAAINAYKTVWHYPDAYKNVIIHLGSFHFIKENFKV